MVPDVRFDIQPVHHHFVVRGIHVVRIVFGHIEPDQDVPKNFPLITEHDCVNVRLPGIRLVRHVVLDILVRDIPAEGDPLVDGCPKETN